MRTYVVTIEEIKNGLPRTIVVGKEFKAESMQAMLRKARIYLIGFGKTIDAYRVDIMEIDRG